MPTRPCPASRTRRHISRDRAEPIFRCHLTSSERARHAGDDLSDPQPMPPPSVPRQPQRRGPKPGGKCTKCRKAGRPCGDKCPHRPNAAPGASDSTPVSDEPSAASVLHAPAVPACASIGATAGGWHASSLDSNPGVILCVPCDFSSASPAHGHTTGACEGRDQAQVLRGRRHGEGRRRGQRLCLHAPSPWLLLCAGARRELLPWWLDGRD